MLSVDNCVECFQQEETESLSQNCGSGEPIDTPCPPASTHSPRPSALMSIFEPRPFPPPSLVGVPIEYIIKQLHTLAPGYWDHPETADCTLLIPVPHFRRQPSWFSGDPEPLAGPPPCYETAGRRASAPVFNSVPQITMNLHMDYLCAHSAFIRALFSESSPVDLINPSSSLSGASGSGSYSIPPDRLPRLMPRSTAAHPVLYLPVPDPSSLHLLIHWMYFGTTDLISDALRRGIVQWEGIARNVEYLGLPSEIKVFLGRWYGNWLRASQFSAEKSDQEDAVSDTVYSDSLDDDMMDDDDSESASESGTDVDMVESDKEEPLSRGRDRGTRCLSWTSTHSSFSELSLATDQLPSSVDSGLSA